MKKLGKLSINPEKVMKNEELIHLRGGEYGTDNSKCKNKCTADSECGGLCPACSDVSGDPGAKMCTNR